MVADPITEVFVDQGWSGGVSFVLKSGRSGTVHVEHDLNTTGSRRPCGIFLPYRLTLEAQKRIVESPLSKREIVRRLRTSAAQLDRLVDQTNYRKSVDHDQ